jgi:hypothetical protein
MTSWDQLRAAVVRGTPGTTGELADLNRAIRVFNALAHFLIDEEAARVAMLDDPRALQAIALSGELEGIGILEPGGGWPSVEGLSLDASPEIRRRRLAALDARARLDTPEGGGS